MDPAGEQELPLSAFEVPAPTTGSLPGVGPSAQVVSGLGRNALWQYLNFFASSLAGIFIIGFSVRRLGTAAYGLFALAVAIIGILNTVDFGLRLAVIRATARDADSFKSDERAQARGDVGAAHFAYGSAGIVAVVVSSAAALVVFATTSGLPATEHLSGGVALIGLSAGLSLGTSAFGGVLIGRRQFQIPAIGGVLGTAVELAVVILTINSLRLVALGLGLLLNVALSQSYSAWWLRRHEHWFRLLPRRHGWRTVRRVAVFAAPLIVLPLAAQIIPATDLAVVGAVATASAVGLYQAGSIIPAGVISLLFTGFDTIYPHLAGTSNSLGQERDVQFLTRIVAFIGGAAFAALILLRSDVISIVLGHPSALAESVLIVFCGIWLANIPAHGPALLLIARGRQRLFVPLVAGEAIANLALTAPFAIWMGPIGAAVATLVTISASNLVIFPHLVRHEFLTGSIWIPTAEAIGAMAVGATSASIAVAPCLLLHSGWGRLVVGLVSGGVVSCVLGLVFLRPPGRSRLNAILRRPAGA